MPVLPPHLATIAERNHGVLVRADLLAVPDVTRALVDNLVRHGALVPYFRGTYRVPGAPVTTQQELLAAARRANGHIADATALALRDAEGFPLQAPFRVAIPRARRLRVEELTIVRTDLEDQDVEVHDGVPTMTVERACIGVAPHVRLARLRTAVHDLRRRGVLDVRVLRRRVDALAGDLGAEALRAHLSSGALLPESEPEAALDDIWQPGDPRPAVQVWVHHRGRDVRLDTVFLTSRLAPEYDGERAHGGTVDRLADADRTMLLAELRILRLAITAPMLRDPAGLRDRLLHLHHERITQGIEPLVPSAPPAWWDGV